ncbi:MAG: hypothetical protein U0325_27655 [Polyangiales bacterium]
MIARPPRVPVRAAASLTLLLGCATASPTLVSARVLPASRFALDLGTAYVTPVAQTALAAARAPGATPADRLRGAVGYAAQPPGVLPFVQGRAGLGGSGEASIALIGRFVRIGARRELLRDGFWTLTAGANARLAFLASGTDTAIPDLQLQESRVYGGELTLQAGYTRRDIYDLWVTARGGYLYADGRAVDGRRGPTPFALAAHRAEAALTLGMRVAFGHFGVGVELEAQYAWSTGGDGVTEVQADQLALVPAGALVYSF